MFQVKFLLWDKLANFKDWGYFDEDLEFVSDHLDITPMSLTDSLEFAQTINNCDKWQICDIQFEKVV